MEEKLKTYKGVYIKCNTLMKKQILFANLLKKCVANSDNDFRNLSFLNDIFKIKIGDKVIVCDADLGLVTDRVLNSDGYLKLDSFELFVDICETIFSNKQFIYIKKTVEYDYEDLVSETIVMKLDLNHFEHPSKEGPWSVIDFENNINILVEHFNKNEYSIDKLKFK